VPIPAHIEGTSIVGSRVPPDSAPNTFTPIRRDPAEELLEGPHHKPFDYTPREQEIIEKRLAELGYLE
jgi:hypothetical protein